MDDVVRPSLRPVSAVPDPTFDKPTLSPQSIQHEQVSPDPAPERRGDPQSFGAAAEAIAGAGADAGESLAEAQVQRLIAWAEARRCVIPEADFEALPLVSDETGEHEVRFRETDRRVVKRTWNGTFGMVPMWVDGGWKPGSATPLDYMLRFAMHNDLFDDDVRLEGIIVSDRSSLLVGATSPVSIVISQRWLVAADPESPHPTVQEIDSYMAERGFDPIPDSFFGYFNESTSLVLLDAKPDNLIKTSAGILPFDVLLLRFD